MLLDPSGRPTLSRQQYRQLNACGLEDLLKAQAHASDASLHLQVGENAALNFSLNQMPEVISEPPLIETISDGSLADIAAASTAGVVVARSGRHRSLTHHARNTHRFVSGRKLVESVQDSSEDSFGSAPTSTKG